MDFDSVMNATGDGCVPNKLLNATGAGLWLRSCNALEPCNGDLPDWAITSGLSFNLRTPIHTNQLINNDMQPNKNAKNKFHKKKLVAFYYRN